MSFESVQVASSAAVGAVFYNNRYEPAMCKTDARVTSQLTAAGLSVQGHAALLLQEPWAVKVGLSPVCHFLLPSKWNATLTKLPLYGIEYVVLCMQYYRSTCACIEQRTDTGS